MKRLKKLLPLLLILMILLTACSSSSTSAENSAAAVVSTAAVSAVLSTTSTIAVDTEFSDRDTDSSYDDSTATHITLNGSTIQVDGDGAAASNGVLTISSAGTYVITGELTDGQIVVEAGDEDKVQIVLNGVTIHCSDNAPLYVKNADKVFVTLNKDTENTLTDGSSYVQSDDNNVDSVIFSKSDLTINGSGTLNITANYENAIVSKDDLVITGGTYNITAVEDALNGKDSVKIKDGIFTIDSSEGKGITSKNDEDNTKGYVYIGGGTIAIKDSYEGIEGTAIIIEGGSIDITSSDDGFNAASASAAESDTSAKGGQAAMENDENCYISISGGTIKVNASGDGLDSNGSMYISGGTVYVSGPTNSGNGGLDYNGTADISGGTVVVAGSSGMAQGFSDTSSQYSLLYNFTSSIAAGTEVTLTDESGNVVLTYTPDKDYQSVVISTSDLKEGSTYTLSSGSQTADIEITSIATSAGASGGMAGHGGPGGGHSGQPPQGGAPGQAPSARETTDQSSTSNSN
jgi:hypothetical protein